jgi:hypothetical protein
LVNRFEQTLKAVHPLLSSSSQRIAIFSTLLLVSTLDDDGNAESRFSSTIKISRLSLYLYFLSNLTLNKKKPLCSLCPFHTCQNSGFISGFITRLMLVRSRSIHQISVLRSIFTLQVKNIPSGYICIRFRNQETNVILGS